MRSSSCASSRRGARSSGCAGTSARSSTGSPTLTEQTAESAARASDQATLEQSLGRLRATLAQFAVLRGAVDEATATFGRFTALYPRK